MSARSVYLIGVTTLLACGGAPEATQPDFATTPITTSDAATAPADLANGVALDGATVPGSADAAMPVAPSTGKVKWHPGHYMASYGVVYAGNTSSWQWEMQDLAGHDGVLGYRMEITWGAIEHAGEGQYDFSVIDANLAYLKKMNKRLVIMIGWYSMSAHTTGDVSVVPAYIQADSAYGASPVAGSYGWWGEAAGGKSTGMYAPAVYNAAVMDRFIAMVQALGKRYDTDPDVEAIFFQEDAAIVQAAAAWPDKDPSYSDTAFVTQSERLLTAAAVAFPTTNLIMGNTFLASGASATQLEQWMATHRIAAGAADTVGQTGIAAKGYGLLSPGIAAYVGQNTQGGGTIDLRPKMPCMMDVESGDMSTAYFQKDGGPWTPSDIVDGLNTTYQATHAFWVRMTGTNIPAVADWPALAATLDAKPLLRTAYPASYPQ